MNTDIATCGEEIVKQLKRDERTGSPRLTTSQIRKFLSAVNSIHNKIQNIDNENELPEQIVKQIQYLRIKLAYQAGRSDEVKELRNKAKLDERIKEIAESKSKNEFQEFAHFIEAIVAYHKFYGGN